MPTDVTLDHCVIHVSDWERSNAVLPGNSDLCFRWPGPIATAVEHLQRHAITVELGPVTRHGTQDAGTSVYFRDPDGSLLEFISYE